LIVEYGLGADVALVRLATIVHAVDVSADVDSDPAGVGLLAIGVGGLLVEEDDERLLERATFVYDALYEWCRSTGEKLLGPDSNVAFSPRIPRQFLNGGRLTSVVRKGSRIWDSRTSG
jgi:hypothetical protein